MARKPNTKTTKIQKVEAINPDDCVAMLINTLKDFNDAGVDFREMSPTERKRCYDVMDSIDEAFEKRDVSLIIDRVIKWRTFLPAKTEADVSRK